MTYEEYLALRKTVATPFGDFAYLDIGEGPPAVLVHYPVPRALRSLDSIPASRTVSRTRQ